MFICEAFPIFFGIFKKCCNLFQLYFASKLFSIILDVNKHTKKPAVVAEQSKALSQIQVERMP